MLKICFTTHSKAERVESPQYGVSKGTAETNRVVFEGFNDTKHYVAALFQGPGFFESFSYKPLEVLDQNGLKTTIWVNENSFRKRFETDPSDQKAVEKVVIPKRAQELHKAIPSLTVGNIEQMLYAAKKTVVKFDKDAQGQPLKQPLIVTPEGSAYAAVDADQCIDLATGKTYGFYTLMKKHLPQALLFRQLKEEQIKPANLENVPQQADRLLPVLQELTQDPSLQADDIGQMLLQAAAKRSKSGKKHSLVNPKKDGFKRPLLVTPETTYILLTATESGDRLLGEGSSKETYLAVDAATGVVYAVGVNKDLATIPANKERLDNEATIMRRLNRERGAVHLVDDITIDSCPATATRYFIMEYCGKGNLADAIKEGTLTPDQKLQIALDISEILRVLHQKGIVYRDLKPENILLYEDETGKLRAKLCDFGTAAFLTNQAMLRKFEGTPEFFSPELASAAIRIHELAMEVLKAKQAKGLRGLRLFEARNYSKTEEAYQNVEEASKQKTDIWELGSTLFFLFHPNGGDLMSGSSVNEKSGLSTQESDDQWLLLKRTSSMNQDDADEMLADSGIDARLQPLLRRMLAVSPEDRTITAGEIFQELAQIPVA